MPTLKEIQDYLRNPAARKASSKSLDEIVQAGRGALKHGLAGQMPVILPENTLKVAAERQQRWREQYQPSTPHEEFLFEHLCIDSVRLDQASRAVLAQEDEQALQARESWDFDRTLDAVRLAAGIHDRPEQVAMQLEQCLHGCRWLIAQWEEIREQVQEDKAWKTSVWTRTLNLLGVPLAGRERATSLLLGLGKSMQASLGLIDAKLLELRAKVREDLEARDARLRADTAMGLIAKPSPELKLARRYHRELVRRVQWYKSELLRLRQERLAPPCEASSTDSTDSTTKSKSPKKSARPLETSAIVAPSTETSAEVASNTRSGNSGWASSQSTPPAEAATPTGLELDRWLEELNRLGDPFEEPEEWERCHRSPGRRRTGPCGSASARSAPARSTGSSPRSG
jgi:hypothetical protein